MYPVIKAMQAVNKFEVHLIAPANHPCIPDEFKDGTTKFTNGIYSIDDYGSFFDEVKFLLQKFQADLVVLLGDRWEVHAVATAALLLNIPIAHIHGGEATRGCFDDELRNAISMMATYHFTSNEKYGRNVINMTSYDYVAGQGFYSGNVYNVGAPIVDTLLRMPIIHKIQLQETFKIDFDKEFVIAVFHPVTKELPYTRQHITNLLNALYRWGEQVIFVMPNIDPENGIIREQINSAAQKAMKKWQVCENIDRELFVSLMAHADMIVGNSSAGIIEAGYLNLPAVNIGTRQKGRIKAANVIDCGYSEEDIFSAISVATHLKAELKAGNVKIKMPYGKGDSGKMIAEVLERELFPIRTCNSSCCGTESGD
jgi:UDP-hydrolysing UDP-N-acetyl-D-glucosamine 2-epimerase